jgi:hypothetical protein
MANELGAERRRLLADENSHPKKEISLPYSGSWRVAGERL